MQFVNSNPSILFRRCEARLGGVGLIDDITDYNRFAQLFTIYQPTGKRLQTSQLGFNTHDTMAHSAEWDQTCGDDCKFNVILQSTPLDTIVGIVIWL